jgi:cysteinyl-tRNA synthetase
MNDDFNSPVLISHLFDGVRIINSVYDKKETITAADLELLKKTFNEFVFDILGLKDEVSSGKNELLDELMNTVLEIRNEARANKDFATSDKIRDELKNIGIIIKDTKNGVEWSVEE